MTPTPEQVEAWAREAGAGFDDAFESVGPNPMWVMSPEELQRFAALACAWQREMDAQICDRLTTALDIGGNEYRREAFASQCARAIRSDCAVPGKAG